MDPAPRGTREATDTQSRRKSHEALALAGFHDIAIQLGLTPQSSQVRANRVTIRGTVYYQFGDLRVERPTHTVVIEVESSGGVGNLAKYWECLASDRLSKPLKLLHLFQQKSLADYESHHIVWRFLCGRMHQEFGDRFEGRLETYRLSDPKTLTPAQDIFREWLTS